MGRSRVSTSPHRRWWLLAISLSIGLFIMTTEARAFVFDLERRGVPARFAFVALATIEAVPTLVERAATIGESQRARASTPRAAFWARTRGLLPLVGPAMITSLTDVEERSLALESRAFSRPGDGTCCGRCLTRVASSCSARSGPALVVAVAIRIAGVPLPVVG